MDSHLILWVLFMAVLCAIAAGQLLKHLIDLRDSHGRDARIDRKAAIAALMAFLRAGSITEVQGAPMTAANVAATCLKGAWSSTTAYTPGEVVTYKGASYMSLVRVPLTHWDLVGAALRIAGMGIIA